MGSVRCLLLTLCLLIVVGCVKDTSSSDPEKLHTIGPQADTPMSAAKPKVGTLDDPVVIGTNGERTSTSTAGAPAPVENASVNDFASNAYRGTAGIAGNWTVFEGAGAPCSMTLLPVGYARGGRVRGTPLCSGAIYGVQRWHLSSDTLILSRHMRVVARLHRVAPGRWVGGLAGSGEGLVLTR